MYIIPLYCTSTLYTFSHTVSTNHKCPRLQSPTSRRRAHRRRAHHNARREPQRIRWQGIGPGAASIPSTSRLRRVLTQEHTTRGFKCHMRVVTQRGVMLHDSKGCYVICPAVAAGTDGPGFWEWGANKYPTDQAWCGGASLTLA